MKKIKIKEEERAQGSKNYDLKKKKTSLAGEPENKISIIWMKAKRQGDRKHETRGQSGVWYPTNKSFRKTEQTNQNK